MSDDGTDGDGRDPAAVAASLRQVADRLEAGEPLPFGDDETALTATPPVSLGVKTSVGDDETRVRIALSWSTGGGREEARERGGTRRGASVGEDGTDGPDIEAAGDDLPPPSAGTGNAERAAHELDRAVHFAGKGKTRAADSRFRQAVEADPADPAIRRRYADFLLAVDEPERAMAQFRRALEIDPEDPQLHVATAEARWRLGDTAAATEAFERALDLAPEDPDVLSTYGRFCWEEREDVEAAVEHLQRALEADDDHALAHLNFAVLLRHGGHDERAASHYDRALELAADNATVQAEYGHYLWANGDVEEAARHYAKARELGAEL